MKAIDAGDVNATKFFLETRGKRRGYTRCDYDILTVDPRRLTDGELDRAIEHLEARAVDLDAEPPRR